MNSPHNGLLAQVRVAAPAVAVRPGLRWRLMAAFDWLLGGIERARSRRELAALDDRLLHDIGLARLDADREASKPFWQP
jgi:uncharacterized protein YjiS (DUF1127 family)